MKPKRPPLIDETECLELLNTSRKEYDLKVQELLAKDVYYSYCDLTVRSGKLKTTALWYLFKQIREYQFKTVCEFSDEPTLARFIITDKIHQTISEIDKYTTNAALDEMTRQIGEERYFKFLINDLIKDESISSSQLEGAATTTIVARDMLQQKRKPRTMDEGMIVGNFKMMEYVWENKNEELSLAFIKKVHRIGVSDIDNTTYTPGKFRGNDNVVVQSHDGEVIHKPPLAENLELRIEKIIEWVNSSQKYTHPLIKAIILHFMIGFEHPFKDGNGRVARALFYWYMFKNGYPSFRFINISKLLKEAPSQYVRAYLKTEYDNLDLTYFIEYQCGIISRALSNFIEEYKQALKEMNDFESWMYNSGLLSKLKPNEKTILVVAQRGMAGKFTIQDTADSLGCSYGTAASSLNKLVEMDLFVKRKIGKQLIYDMKSIKNIIKMDTSKLDAWK